MAVELKHAFQSPVSDAGEPDIVGPNEWNANHLLTMEGPALIGRASAGQGPAVEIGPSTALTLIGAAASSHTHAATDIVSGVLAYERGGLEADVSAFDGLVRIAAGVTTAVAIGIASGNVALARNDPNSGEIAVFTSDGIEGLTASELKTALDLEIGTDVQAWSARLDEIAALGVTDGNIIVADGSGWVAESGATARTSLGLGTGNTPQFTALEIGNASDTTLARSGAGDLSIEGNVIYRAGGTDVALSDGGTGASLSDPGADRLMGWDDTAGAVKFFALTDFNVHTHPVAGDYLIGYSAAGAMVRIDVGDIEGIGGSGGGITAIVQDTSPELGGNLDVGAFTVGDASAADLTKLSEITATSTELNYVDGVTSAIQTQIDGKQPLDSDLTAIAALTTTAAGRSILTFADPGADRVLAWDDSANAAVPIALADITTEASPATGDYLLAYTAEGALVKVDWSDLPGAGGGISNVVEDTTPQLGGDLDVNGHEIQSAGDLVLQIGDNAGANKLSLQDSDGAEVFAVSSDGAITLSGTVDGRDLATDGAKLDGIEAGADVTLTELQAATSETSLQGADRVPFLDQSDSLSLKYISGNNLLAFFAGVFDTFYATVAQGALADTSLQPAAIGTTVQGYDADLAAIAGLSPTNDDILQRKSGAWTNRTIAQLKSDIGNATTTATGVVELATAAEFRTGTDTARPPVVNELWAAAESVTLTNASPVVVSLSSMLTLADIALTANRTLDFTNVKEGQHFIIKVTASGATRTLTMDSIAVLWDGVETGPYSITTSQVLYVCGFIGDGGTPEITAIGRRAA